MTEEILAHKNLVVRHSMLELIEHWAIAISGLILILTGIFELPVAKRYYIITLPGLGWSADFITSLYLHYAAAFVFSAVGIFHLAYHGLRGEKGLLPQKGDAAASITVIKSFIGLGKEPPMHKYLPEQRLAYAGMAFIILMLILSGLVKTYKNIYAPDMSHTVLLWATWIHNIGFVLFFLAFLAHMAAIALRPNWPMVRGIFTGKVRLDYARHRHSLWLKEIEQEQNIPAAVSDETTPPAKMDPTEATQPTPQPGTQHAVEEKMEDIRSGAEDEGKPPQTEA
ncbi:MAG: putative rane protein [Deltaproteobacteria bacterium]|nr:putative rane protein [Deltaproteobacteria bacterium]